MTDPLTSRQRAHLRSLAHRLKPVVHVGTDGLTDGVIDAVEDALRTRELIKVRVREGAPLEAEDAATDLAARVDGAHVPQVIGRTVVVYRAFPDDPEIRLP